MVHGLRWEFDGREKLRSLLCSTEKEKADFLLIAIGFEGVQNIAEGFQGSRSSQLGISILDTRDLQTHLELQLDRENPPPLRTRNFCTGNNAIYVRAVQKFRFGVSEAISIYNIAAKIVECLKQQDPESDTGEYRDVTLVFQGGNTDKCLLGNLKVSQGGNTATVSSVLEVSRLADEVSGSNPRRRLGLRDLVIELGIPFDGNDFHNARNDAEYIMRVLLQLAVRDYDEQLWKGADIRRVHLLRKIGRSRLPVSRTPAEQDRLAAL